MELLLGQVMPIPSHALAVIAAVVLGGAQLASAKGHRGIAPWAGPGSA
jgi:ribose/xylose/arabinose/galactoside ABC-type transport system permease subunit